MSAPNEVMLKHLRSSEHRRMRRRADTQLAYAEEAACFELSAARINPATRAGKRGAFRAEAAAVVESPVKIGSKI